jgi:hypothetical protein
MDHTIRKAVRSRSREERDWRQSPARGGPAAGSDPPRAAAGRGEPVERASGPVPAAGTGLTDRDIREAWLRAEACCECEKASHGHPGRCNQFLIWAARGDTGKGAWEARPLHDPRRSPCDILCAACYANTTGRVSKSD